jgi:hypothetical protein
VACHHPNRAPNVHRNCGTKERRSDGLSGRTERTNHSKGGLVRLQGPRHHGTVQTPCLQGRPYGGFRVGKVFGNQQFLAIDTGIKAIKRVITKVEVTEGEGTTVKREATTASRAACTAFNKVDELKKVVDALAKRVGRLES